MLGIWSKAVTAGLFAASMLSLVAPAHADDYPTKNITVINPWTAGGAADTIARPIMQKLQDALGKPVVLENKPGANGTIGASIAARAKPDGYTLFLSHVGPMAISPALQDLSYNPITDFEPITQLVSGPLVLVARPDLGFKTVQDLVSYAAANPGKLSYGSVGIGSTTHLAGELLAQLGKVSLLHVPYKGDAQISTDMIGGQIDFAFMNIAAAMNFVKDNRLTPLAVTTAKRSSVLPDLPAVSETLPGFEVNSWYGLAAPKGTPKAIVDRLQVEVAKILKTPDMIERLHKIGLDVEASTPSDHAAKIKGDTARWAALIKSVGVTLKN